MSIVIHIKYDDDFDEVQAMALYRAIPSAMPAGLMLPMPPGIRIKKVDTEDLHE